MGKIASQITSLTIVYSTVYSDADQRKHQSSASLAFVRGIHRGPVNSPQNWPVTRKIFPFADVIIDLSLIEWNILQSHDSIIRPVECHVRWLHIILGACTLSSLARSCGLKHSCFPAMVNVLFYVHITSIIRLLAAYKCLPSRCEGLNHTDVCLLWIEPLRINFWKFLIKSQ